VTHQNADGERGIHNPGRTWKDLPALDVQHVAKDLNSLRTAISSELGELPAPPGYRVRRAPTQRSRPREAVASPRICAARSDIEVLTSGDLLTRVREWRMQWLTRSVASTAL
jgi:hypothetical protein